jgi:hypothetical protein
MEKRVKSAIQQATSQEARDRAKAMQRTVQDQFDDEKVAEVFDSAGDDAIDFGTGIVKGPVVRSKKVERWNEAGEKVIAIEADKQKMLFEAAVEMNRGEDERREKAVSGSGSRKAS